MAAEGSVPRQIDIGGSVGIGNAGGAVPRLIGHVRVAGMIAGGDVSAADAVAVAAVGQGRKRQQRQHRHQAEQKAEQSFLH